MSESIQLQDKKVLCGANSYDLKYYFNEEFSALPASIRDELQIMCVMYTEDVGGILTLVFDEQGSLKFEVSSMEHDFNFDEIGSALKIKEIQRTKIELLESLEMFYKVFITGDRPAMTGEEVAQ